MFLQIGGEGSGESDYWLSNGAWIEWAKEQKAALFIFTRPIDRIVWQIGNKQKTSLFSFWDIL